MRRRIRKEFTWSSSSWLQTNEVHYIYDGNVVIGERDINNLTATIYTRGPDLSGTRQGAGGIGGLLARTDQRLSTINSPLSTSFYHCDGNGNVTCLINTNQAIVAEYEYDPFGGILSQSGSLADANLYRFSSKEYHPNSGLVYYLYRLYDPNLQRWLNRDPVGERGGLNLYRFCRNTSADLIDSNGRYVLDDEGFPVTPTGTAMDTYISDPNEPTTPPPPQTPSGQTGSSCPPPYGTTVQIGLSLNGQLGPLNGNWSVGIAFDSQGHAAVYDTIGIGNGIGADASGGVSLAASNAGRVNDIAGPFAYGTTSLGSGLNGSGDVFAGAGSQGQTIVGGGFTAGFGGGGGAATGISQTYVHPLW